MKKILVCGYGNPGRQDDGLGILLAEMIDEWAKAKGYKNIVTDTNFQLNIEDAYNLNLYDIVIYLDASKEEIEAYLFEKLSPRLNTNFSMHSVSPSFVLGLCQEIYNSVPQSYLLHIKGYQWEFMVDPTDKAYNNLKKAYTFLKNKIEILIN